MIADPEIFRLFEEEEIDQALEEIITRSLIVKKHVVEEDEKEQKMCIRDRIGTARNHFSAYTGNKERVYRNGERLEKS